MTVAPYVLTEEQGDAYWFLGNLVTIKAGAAQTRGRLTVAEFVNPPGFAPPLHRHLEEDEAFYILGGSAEFRCGEHALPAGPGDFVLLPVGLAHTFIVGPDEPLRCLQITTPGGFESFAAAAGQVAGERRLPDPSPIDPAVLGHAAAANGLEILGPPPGR
jgi:mannose-6-phosphate isomerase-like protein (cupin superfamily)